MKFVIQRVLQGSVKVNEKIVGEIGPGLVVLVGFTHSDKTENLKFAANKLLLMRLWDDDKGTRWKECVKDRKFGLLIVSQFTLYSFLKGNKPDYHNAMDPKNATVLYNEFLKILKQFYDPEKIESGMFGEKMQVSLINDGPVTINWEYPEFPEKNALTENNKSNNKESEFNLKEKDEPSNNNNDNLNNKKKENKNNNKSKFNNKAAKNKKEDLFEIEKDLDKLNFKIEEKIEGINDKNANNIKNNSNDEAQNNINLIKLPDEI